jgi:glycosyltransferase involved in cell wall biosynthesis
VVRSAAASTRLMLMYLGRRGAMSQFAFEAACSALADPRIATTICVSRQNDKFSRYRTLGSCLLPVNTFDSVAGAGLKAWRIPLIRHQIYRRIRRDRVQLVIELMPHIWSPFIVSAIRSAGAQYSVVIHDAIAHPGDPTGWAKNILDQTIRLSDRVITLSETVGRTLVSAGRLDPGKLVTLFHPDMNYGDRQKQIRVEPGQPIRLLFLGRILRYKGLPLFLDTIDALRAEGIPVEFGVFGEGALGPSATRLTAMRAEVINRWLREEEIPSILGRFHAVIVSHIEASQSGVVATALGAGVPVVATPVGGLVEQVIDGVTGMIASGTSASALAEAVKRLIVPHAYDVVCDNIAAAREQRSMARFLEECVKHVRRDT